MLEVRDWAQVGLKKRLLQWLVKAQSVEVYEGINIINMYSINLLLLITSV